MKIFRSNGTKMPNINVHSCVIINMHIAHTEEEIEINANQAN